MKKAVISLLIVFCMVFSSVNTCALSANSAVLIDGDTGKILIEKNSDKQLPMASTTKIMTAITAIEAGNIDRTISVKKEYTLVEGSSMYLKPEEKLSLRDVLYGLMLMSGNDAALCIAGECGGLKNFVQKMNDNAKKLGLTNTHFDNPNGLDGKTHYTTAYELAQITAHAMQNEIFHEIVGTKNYKTKLRAMKNHNRLLWLCEDAVGVKTGFTKKSGRCLVSAAEKNGRRLIAVTLNAPDDWNDHMTMYKEGFSRYSAHDFHKAQDKISDVPVISGLENKVSVKTTKDLAKFVSDTELTNFKIEVIGKKFVYAPVKKGDIYGKIKYIAGNTVLCEDDLVYDETVDFDETQEVKSFWDRLLSRLRALV